ncbi:hypothetical protein P7C73_g434, partial [Tremellales sp. Uapishka_1]
MSAPSQSSQVILASRPGAGEIKSDTFKLETVDVPELQDGQVLVRTDYVSIDPAMRGWLEDVRSYLPPVKLGEVMRAGGIGTVISSKSDSIKEGQVVRTVVGERERVGCAETVVQVGGMFGWQEYWVGSAKEVQPKTTPKGGQEVDHLGLFGMAGMTAYFGIFEIGNIKDGDHVVVSGAAGSVGLIVAQIALAHPKCKVTAIAGSDDKCASLKALGCHHVLNYKDADLKKKFKSTGLIDVYFDNVGGEILDLALAQLNPYARIVCCGAISGYNSTESYGLKNTASLISMKAKMQGYIVFDHAARFAEAEAYLAQLKEKGQLKYDYHLLNGVAKCPEALQEVFAGKNYGKCLVKISKEAGSSKL